MFCSTQALNVHSCVVDLHDNGMAARAATSTTTRRLPMLRRVGSNNCSLVQSICRPFSQLAERTWRINVAGAEAEADADAAQDSPMYPYYQPADVSEIKCSPLNMKTEFKPKPELDILVHDRNEDGYACFWVHSVDGTCISPGDIIQPPSPVGEEYWFFWNISCNGLLYFRGLGHNHLLWNPKTNEFKLLPPSQNVPLPPHTEHIPVDYGMWYDNKCEDYKLVIAVLADLEDEKGLTSSYEHHFDVYSLRSNSWKRIPIPEDFGPLRFRYGACINGCFHTISCPEDTESLLTFNLVDETISISPLPSSTVKGFIWILDYKGLVSLLVSSIPKPFPDLECAHWPEYELWVLLDGSWTKESTFITCSIRNPLFFSRSGRLLYFATYIDAELVVFDRATGELKHLGIFKPHPVQFSLSSIKLNEASDVEAQKHEMEKYLNSVEEFL